MTLFSFFPGYFARVRALERIIGAFREAAAPRAMNMVMLGAGLDSLFFRLRAAGQAGQGFHTYEVDFEPVMRQKVACIKRSEGLRSVLGPDLVINEEASGPVLLSCHEAGYTLLAGDLADPPRLEGEGEGGGGVELVVEDVQERCSSSRRASQKAGFIS